MFRSIEPSTARSIEESEKKPIITPDDDDLIFFTELKQKMDLGLARYQVDVMRGNMSPQVFGEIIMAAMQAITDVRKERGLRDAFVG